ncbi:MAG: tetratricopeptide repeat protein [Crocinitomicaceae bacterium]
MTKLLAIIILFISVTTAVAQTQKQVNKSIKIYNKNSAKGIAKLEKYIAKAPNFGNDNGWGTLINMEYRQYSFMKEMFDGMKISVENEGNDTTNTISGESIMSSLSESNDDRFIAVCRKASVMSTTPLADLYIRKIKLDYEPDSLISDTAKAFFEEGESFFVKEDFEMAKLNYRKAINVSETYYKAVLYLGDAYWREDNYDSAIFYFSIAKELQPDLIEPRKYLIDALMGKQLWERAKEECLDAFCVYPSYGLKYRYMDILKQENKWMYTKNIKRDFFANNMSDSAQEPLIAPYNAYRNAKNEREGIYNIDGIILSEKQSTDRYLEVNSWRAFLEKNENNLPPIFRFAAKMNKADYLDCYIFFTFFHYDIYPQFQDFMSTEKNREKMKTFIKKYLIDEY